MVALYNPRGCALCARNDDEGVSLVMSLVMTSERASHNDSGLSPVCPNEITVNPSHLGGKDDLRLTAAALGLLCRSTSNACGLPL